MDYLASYHEDISIRTNGMHGFALRAVNSRSLVLIIFVVQLPIQRCWKPSSSFIDLNMSEVKKKERERDLVNYGPIVYWRWWRRGQRAADFIKAAFIRVVCGWERESTLRMHLLHVADFVLWEQMESLSKSASQKTSKADSIATWWKTWYKPLYRDKYSSDPGPRHPRRWLSFTNRSSNYSSKMSPWENLTRKPKKPSDDGNHPVPWWAKAWLGSPVVRHWELHTTLSQVPFLQTIWKGTVPALAWVTLALVLSFEMPETPPQPMKWGPLSGFSPTRFLFSEFSGM